MKNSILLIISLTLTAWFISCINKVDNEVSGKKEVAIHQTNLKLDSERERNGTVEFRAFRGGLDHTERSVSIIEF